MPKMTFKSAFAYKLNTPVLKLHCGIMCTKKTKNIKELRKLQKLKDERMLAVMYAMQLQKRSLEKSIS